MGKTLAYRLFRVGRIPEQFKAQMEAEGIVIQDEGFSGSTTYKNFHRPGVYSGWRRVWHTAALTMRLLVESELKPAGGVIGAGFDEFRWPLPGRPGDELHVESEILEVRSSKSRPDQGLMKVRTTTLNQRGEAVQIHVGNLLVQRRPAAQEA